MLVSGGVSSVRCGGRLAPRADSGTSYLCPLAALNRLSDPKEEDLKRICVDESENPQND